NPRRSALTVATIAVGIGAVFWLRFAAYSFERSVIEALTPAFRADLIAGSVHVESGVFETPVDQRLAVRLRRMNGVRAVAGERVREWPYRGGPVTIEAYDDAYYTTGDFGQWPLYGSSLADAWGMVARGTATVVSSSFVSGARRLLCRSGPPRLPWSECPRRADTDHHPRGVGGYAGRRRVGADARARHAARNRHRGTARASYGRGRSPSPRAPGPRARPGGGSFARHHLGERHFSVPA